MNEQSYWEHRFSTRDWEKCSGKEQTRYFGQLLLDHLPEWLKKEWLEEKYIICDMGCAEGECADLLAKNFAENRIVGVDFSESALEAGRKSYPAVCFEKDDVYTTRTQYDVIILSNVLEHLEKPNRVLQNLMQNARRYLVVMVPLDDVFDIPEHINHFSFDSFSEFCGSGKLCYHEWIYCGKQEWFGYQLLLVYSSDGTTGKHRLLSESTGGPSEKSEFETLYQQFQSLQQEFWDAQGNTQKVYAAWEKDQIDLKKVQEELQNAYAGWQDTQKLLQKTQQELDSAYAGWQETRRESQKGRAELEAAYAGWQETREKLQKTQTELETAYNGWKKEQETLASTQAELQNAYAGWQTEHAELNSLRTELQEVSTKWKKDQAELAASRQEAQELRDMLTRIQQSNAWKVLNRVGKICNPLHLKGN